MASKAPGQSWPDLYITPSMSKANPNPFSSYWYGAGIAIEVGLVVSAQKRPGALPIFVDLVSVMLSAMLSMTRGRCAGVYLSLYLYLFFSFVASQTAPILRTLSSVVHTWRSFVSR